jgi:hypothetical protein
MKTRPLSLLFLVALLVLIGGAAACSFSDRPAKPDTTSARESPDSRVANSPFREPAQSGSPAATPPVKPAGAIRFATCEYAGVNVRQSPDKDSAITATINKTQGLWVFRESENYDTVAIKSESRSLTDNWSEVELSDNSSVRGWVFSGFITKDGDKSDKANSSWAAFYPAFRAAVKTRDSAALRGMIASPFLTQSDGELNSPEEVIKWLDESKLWQELQGEVARGVSATSAGGFMIRGRPTRCTKGIFCFEFGRDGKWRLAAQVENEGN